MDKASNLAQQGLTSGFNFKLGSLIFAPTYLQAAAIVFLIFLLILTLARLRRMYVDWSIKGAVAMLVIGFVLAEIVEGFLMLSGRTAFTEILGWKNAPKPIQVALDAGRARLTKVLGDSTQSVSKDTPTYQSVVDDIGKLTPQETRKLKESFCSQ